MCCLHCQASTTSAQESPATRIDHYNTICPLCKTLESHDLQGMYMRKGYLVDEKLKHFAAQVAREELIDHCPTLPISHYSISA